MPEAVQQKPTLSYWVISILLLLWGLGGASIYVAYFVETPSEFALTAETAAHRQVYADYIAQIPVWALAVGIIAAISRLLGAIGLLLRRRWALPLYVMALVFFLAALYRAFVLAGVANVMSPGHIVTEAVFVALNLFAIWFAWRCKSRGIL